jgi:hypothetical protein
MGNYFKSVFNFESVTQHNELQEILLLLLFGIYHVQRGGNEKWGGGFFKHEMLIKVAMGFFTHLPFVDEKFHFVTMLSPNTLENFIIGLYKCKNYSMKKCVTNPKKKILKKGLSSLTNHLHIFILEKHQKVASFYENSYLNRNVKLYFVD